MATRNRIPNTNNEGNIGSAIKNWLKGWFKDLFVSNEITDGSNSATVANIKDAVDKKHASGSDDQTASTVDTEDSGISVQDALNTLESNQYTSDDFNTDFGNKDLDDLADGTTYKKLKVDNFTIKESSNTIKIADRIENNIFLNAFRLAVQGSLTIFNMIDGFLDEYEDESGVDTSASTNEDYDSDNDLYSPLIYANLELDYMEYSTDELAQDAWESSDPSASGGIDENTKLIYMPMEEMLQDKIIYLLM